MIVSKHLESGVFYTADERVAVVGLRGRLDLEADPVMNKISQDMIAQSKDVIFCLNELKYLSPYGIRLLLKLQKELDKGGNKMMLTELSSKAQSSLETTGLSGVFTIQPNLEVALFELLKNEPISNS
jgi:anti-sigma B factor antagonist